MSKPTCAALRITLHSTVALVDILLGSGFRYVLVGNFGQDPLEVTIFTSQASAFTTNSFLLSAFLWHSEARGW